MSVSQDLAGGEKVTIIFLIGAKIGNPDTAGTYDIGVRTSGSRTILCYGCVVTCWANRSAT